jgi:hypothetical protein
MRLRSLAFQTGLPIQGLKIETMPDFLGVAVSSLLDIWTLMSQRPSRWRSKMRRVLPLIFFGGPFSVGSRTDHRQVW